MDNPENRDVSGRFVPGVTGNPGGRPKGIAQLAREHKDKALSVLCAGMDDEDARVRIAAAREILDRGYGKPVAMTADVTDRLDDFDDDALITALDTVRAVIRAGKETGEGTGPQTAH